MALNASFSAPAICYNGYIEATKWEAMQFRKAHLLINNAPPNCPS